MYITNNPVIAKIAEEAGVDRIFIDLEKLYKQERQGGMDTVQSSHTVKDIATVKEVLSTSELLVRSNPIHSGSQEEIDDIISNGADIVMLPFFKTEKEVVQFITYVDGRARVSLLLETAEAVENIDDILLLEGIDEIHIGLNDLHLAYHKRFMFELLTDGTVEMLSQKILAKNIPYGFGGIARLGMGALPAEMIIKEHYRLSSTCAILSRSFCNADLVTDKNELKAIFTSGVTAIRQLEEEILFCKDYFKKNQMQIKEIVTKIIQ